MDNKLSGKVYYGFHLIGSQEQEGLNLTSNGNIFEDNDLNELEIKPPDEYSGIYLGEEMITDKNKQKTSHILLNQYSTNNIIKIGSEESVIDEGQNNTTIVKTN